MTTPDRFARRHFYVEPTVKLGDKLEAGSSVLGVAQDLTKRYDDKMTNHVHVEVRDVAVQQSRCRGGRASAGSSCSTGAPVAAEPIMRPGCRSVLTACFLVVIVDGCDAGHRAETPDFTTPEQALGYYIEGLRAGDLSRIILPSTGFYLPGPAENFKLREIVDKADTHRKRGDVAR